MALQLLKTAVFILMTPPEWKHLGWKHLCSVVFPSPIMPCVLTLRSPAEEKYVSYRKAAERRSDFH